MAAGPTISRVKYAAADPDIRIVVTAVEVLVISVLSSMQVGRRATKYMTPAKENHSS